MSEPKDKSYDEIADEIGKKFGRRSDHWHVCAEPGRIYGEYRPPADFGKKPMSSNPILDRLDTIVGRYVPLQHGRIGLRNELRALLAEVAIDYYIGAMNQLGEHESVKNYAPDIIRKRFGVAPPSEERICPVCHQEFVVSGPGPNKASHTDVAYKHSDGRICTRDFGTPSEES